MHAITHNNALSALIDNHFAPRKWAWIDQRRIIWKRVVDLNAPLCDTYRRWSRPLNGIPREDGFDIPLLLEIWPSFAWRQILKIWNVVWPTRYWLPPDRSPVYVRDLEVEGAPALILKEADKSNFFPQTISWNTCLCSRWSISIIQVHG